MSKESELAASMAAHELAIAAGNEWKRKYEGAVKVVKILRDAIYGDRSKDDALKAAREFLKEGE